MAGLKKKVLRGTLWVSGGSFIAQSFNFIIKIILARLLFPADFGLFAMALILITFINIFTGFGIGSALIYRRKNIDKTFNSAFFLSPIIGVVLCIASLFFSDFISIFFGQPSLSIIIKIMSLTFIIDSFAIVPYAYLTKNLILKKRTYVDTLPILFYGFSAVVLAYMGLGIWSLVISHLIQHFFWVVFLWLFCPWKPSFKFDKDIAIEILHFGKYIFSVSFISFLVNYIDKTIIGKNFGDEGLGYYSFSFNIATLPVNAFTQIIGGVFHPVFSNIKGNKNKLAEAYHSSLKWVVILTLPLAFGLWVLADMFTIALMGDKWAPIIPLLMIFSPYPVLKSVSIISSYLIEGTGHPKKSMNILIIQFIFIAALILPSLKVYGLNGVAYVIMLSVFISMILFEISASRIAQSSS